MAGVLLSLFIGVMATAQVLNAHGLPHIRPFFKKEQKEALLHLFSNRPNVLEVKKPFRYEKGWNIFTSPKEGIDIPRTFRNKTGMLVATYEPLTKVWAVFPKPKGKNEIFLDSIEGGVVFFVLTKDAGEIQLKSIPIAKPCSDIFHSDVYETLQDSGIDKSFAKNEKGTFFAESRYYAKHQKGVYQDTRIVVGIPKIEAKPTKYLYKYGPAIPKSYFLFTKEYEGKFFYVFSYHDKKCYKGIFPSQKIPPFPFLKSYD